MKLVSKIFAIAILAASTYSYADDLSNNNDNQYGGIIVKTLGAQTLDGNVQLTIKRNILQNRVLNTWISKVVFYGKPNYCRIEIDLDHDEGQVYLNGLSYVFNFPLPGYNNISIDGMLGASNNSELNGSRISMIGGEVVQNGCTYPEFLDKELIRTQ